MAIRIRRGPLPTDHFTMIPNDYARDTALSWAARGLLVWLMSHAVSFKVTEEGMIAAGGTKRDGIRSMVGELERAGYLRRDRTFTPGVGTTVDYVLTAPCDGESVVSDDGESVVRADQGEQDVSAGQPDDGKSVAPSYREDQKKTKTPSESSRATRLPEDFIPTPEMREWFAEEKLHLAIDARIEHEKFVNYWVGCPGVKGRKLDWPRTWKNWMWTAAERAPGRRPGSALASISGAPFRPSTTDQKVAETLELGRRMQQQMEESA